MPVIVSMLRGVNVGGHHRIRMDDLRALYESLELRNPLTYIQSGNVVFRSEERSPGRLAARIEDAIERRFAFRPSVILRTASELRDAVARNPFAGRGVNPAKLLVMFLAGEPDREARAKALQIRTAPEEMSIGGREIYIHYPNGMGRSKLVWTAVEKLLETAATGRNWNSVTRLLEMAEELEAA
ncbi:MAG TPA: DUF1697 domain-containing protein [Bryobacteraceae bacterium]|nr:DUF1697 domain-containing protein [Bryobacteraceae bacterium]